MRRSRQTHRPLAIATRDIARARFSARAKKRAKQALFRATCICARMTAGAHAWRCRRAADRAGRVYCSCRSTAARCTFPALHKPVCAKLRSLRTGIAPSPDARRNHAVAWHATPIAGCLSAMQACNRRAPASPRRCCTAPVRMHSEATTPARPSTTTAASASIAGAVHPAFAT